MTHSSPWVVYNPSENSCPTYPAILSTGCFEDFISHSVDIDETCLILLPLPTAVWW